TFDCALFIFQAQPEIQRELWREAPVVLHIPSVIGAMRGVRIVGGYTHRIRNAQHEGRPTQAQVAGGRKRVVIAACIGVAEIERTGSVAAPATGAKVLSDVHSEAGGVLAAN